MTHSICPTIGGRQHGVCTELIHSANENVGVVFGYSHTASPSAHASISVCPAVPLPLHLTNTLISLFGHLTDWKIEAEWPRGKVRGSAQSRRSPPWLWPAMVLGSDEQWYRVLIPHCFVATEHIRSYSLQKRSIQGYSLTATDGTRTATLKCTDDMMCIRLDKD